MTEALRRRGPAVHVKRVRRQMRRRGLWALYPKRSCTMAGPEPAAGTGGGPPRSGVEPRYHLYPDAGRLGLLGSRDGLCPPLRAGPGTLQPTGRPYLRRRVSARPLGRGSGHIPHRLGAPYSSESLLHLSETAGVQVSMGGAGRGYDPLLIERLWCTVKHEEVHLLEYETMRTARTYLRAFFAFYHDARPHQALGYRTPAEVYVGADHPGAAPSAPTPALHPSTRPEANP